MGKPKAPAPPDYAAAAQAQGTADKEAAIFNSVLNNPNVISPYGTQSVTWSPLDTGQTSTASPGLIGLGGWGGGFGGGVTPTTGGSLPGGGLMTPTITQEFSPEQQALYDNQIDLQKRLGSLGLQGANAAGSVIGKNLDLSGAPTVGDTSAIRDSVYNAMMGRVDEDYGLSRDQANSDLIAGGLRPGTKAYDDAMFQLQRGRNDASQQAMIASNQEAERQFGMDTQRRKDYIAELLAGRQTPLNEIIALMSGSQVQNPFAIPGYAPSGNAQGAPIFDATTAQYGADLGRYNAQAAGRGNFMSGLFGLGSAAMLGKPWA